MRVDYNIVMENTRFCSKQKIKLVFDGHTKLFDEMIQRHTSAES